MGLLDTLLTGWMCSFRICGFGVRSPLSGSCLKWITIYILYLNGTGRWPICLEGHALFANVPEAKNYILSLIKEVELNGERNRT